MKLNDFILFIFVYIQRVSVNQINLNKKSVLFSILLNAFCWEVWESLVHLTKFMGIWYIERIQVIQEFKTSLGLTLFLITTADLHSMLLAQDLKYKYFRFIQWPCVELILIRKKIINLLSSVNIQVSSVKRENVFQNF